MYFLKKIIPRNSPKTLPVLLPTFLPSFFSKDSFEKSSTEFSGFFNDSTRKKISLFFVNYLRTDFIIILEIKLLFFECLHKFMYYVYYLI